ncbi:type VI secretion system membrane subunit TssM [Bradyrhizobium sp. U87765 SZCCT0131]|uniref:type VI secretion system membrane subunit TssM n=1 Tax=unclassified Bradyrhizobium TaxID=2631580 RepID=UPI001BA563A3|nr:MULTISPECIES: type VI secretion system membrane subunit TssM [unclassified Bradyrhizobium]MBR1220433.1 type VI secretion system membrane subunit TssM [Bradyrhizobium sp. U87765 SZCCT0131]MBR1263112.1 type VI secretion system membrane subunit TssM [Bradyrhizobium sp. U87765 SZCCT0134]MBR1307005.1 type VI secretion system membrane subunit TssM [Bradyrhizobium sp. U87765 SZCCT0110]MBR1323107.1 type VI secretion system membrane subunit TssM [Bradyrhizobium sp. U87765 SZCCT0109]MBR1345959.1 type
MLRKDIIRIILYGVGLGSLASVIYFAGPFIAFGEWRPLENHIIREIAIVLLVAGVASFGGFSLLRRRKSAAQIAEGISAADQPVSDEPVLKERMKDALATLKTASGNKAGYLYDLPWYVIIGPPGAGKTTALVNSGLKFPLARGATPAAIAGVGGTRYCDWWFTEEAVLIDTAGRYTTQDSDAKADKQSWFSFLDILKKNRSRQPINGVIVAISLEDVITLPKAELAAHADAIRMRLLELHQRLKVSFPVYALFTKADLVAGFSEYFSYLNEAGRRQVWGATFQTADKAKNLVGQVPVEFDRLLERLSEDTLDRLQDEPTPQYRVQLFGFPAQMARLKPQIHDFLNQIFEPTRYHVNANLRGFYFTSGTQQGTPIDQLIGSLARTFGAEEVNAGAYSGTGKSYFLTDLISKVIIGEADWVSTDRAAVRRALILKTAALSLIGVVAIGLIAVWLTSYKRNSDLIEQSLQTDSDYAAAGGPLIKQTLIADRDLDKVLPLLYRLRNAPAGYGARDAAVPLSARWGLSQHDRLLSASNAAYHTALERLFRPRLLYRLEEQLNARLAEPAFVYEALKVYLMVGGLQPPDRELIRSWMQRDWADNLYPGATNAEGRRLLDENLTAMFDLESEQPPLVELDGRLIKEAQNALARLSVAQRAYEFLKSEARSSTAGDWIAARRGGPDVAAVFETASGKPLDTLRVPEFFTYNGFHQKFIARLPGLAERMKKERWVLGDAGQQAAIDQQYDNLANDLLAAYSTDFVAAWRAVLGDLRLKKLLADKPKYEALRALSAPTSPMRQLLESIRDETQLTKERARPANATPSAPPTAPAPVLFTNAQDGSPGARIEEQFKPYHAVLEGDATRRPIDSTVAILNDVAQNLTLMLESPQLAAQATSTLQNDVAALRNTASRLPPPFSDMMRGAAAEFEGNIAASTAGQILQSLRDQVTPVCQQTVTNRYPFVRGSNQEVPLADFAKLFSPNGVMDKFFTQYLAPYADTSRSDWNWRKESPVSRSFSPDTLKQFQNAAYIRDAFFQSGGGVPMVSLAVRPPGAAGPGVAIKTEIGGTTINSPVTPAPAAPSMFGAPTPPPPPPPPQSNPPVTVQWPGASPRTAISVSNETGQPSVLERIGPWSLFRMLEAGSLSAKAETANATFIVAGRELSYQISTGSVRNPLNLTVLREFRCPTGI